MLTFTASFLSNFKRTQPMLRYGQEFHQWARLDKITGEDGEWCDKLYQMDYVEATQAIHSRTDYTQ
jgi:hypothetical protein